MPYISSKKVARNGKTYRYYYVGESKREGKRVKSIIIDWIGTDGEKLAAWRKRLYAYCSDNNKGTSEVKTRGFPPVY